MRAPQNKTLKIQKTVFFGALSFSLFSFVACAGEITTTTEVNANSQQTNPQSGKITVKNAGTQLTLNADTSNITIGDNLQSADDPNLTEEGTTLKTKSNGNFSVQLTGIWELKGTTEFEGETLNTGGIINHGQFTQTNGKTLTLSNADFTNKAGGQTTFNGTLKIDGASNKLNVEGGKVELKGSGNSLAGALNVSGGELTLDSGKDLTMGSASISGGKVNLAGSITNSGAFMVSGGELTLSGNSNSMGTSATISGGQISISGSNNSFGGNTTISGGELSLVGNGTTFANALTHSGGRLTSNNNADISITTGGFSLTGGTANLQGNISITAGGMNVSGGEVTLGGSNNSITAGGLTVSGGEVTLSGGSKTTVNGSDSLKIEGTGILNLTQGGTIDLGTTAQFEQSGGTLNAKLTISGDAGNIDGITGGSQAKITGGKLNFTTQATNPTGNNIKLQLAANGGAGGGTTQQLKSESGLTASDVTFNGRQSGYINNIATYVLTGLNSTNGLALSIVVDPKSFCNFEGGNCSLAQVLRDMNNNFDKLPEDYKAFFNALINTRPEDYSEALRAMDNKSHINAQEMLLNMQSADILEKVRNLQEGNAGVFLKPRYARLQNNALITHRTGFEFYANSTTHYGMGSIFANYDRLSGNDLSADIFNAGIAARTHWWPVGVFGGVRGGFANTTAKNTRLGHYSQDKYVFHTTHAAFFAGLDKKIAIYESTHLLPTAYLAYFYQKNHSFRTQGMDFDHLINHTDITGGNNTHSYSGKKLFARHARGTRPHYVSLNLGAAIEHDFAQKYRWSAHAFYERRLNSDKIKSRSYFFEYPGTWIQEQNIGKNMLRLGADLRYQPSVTGFFALLGFDFNKAFGANNYRDYGVDAKLGIHF